MTTKQIKQTKLICCVSMITVIVCIMVACLFMTGCDLIKPKVQDASWQELDKDSALIGEERAKRIEKYFNDNPEKSIDDVIWLDNCGTRVVEELHDRFRD